MVEIYINDKQVFPAEKQSIKLTRENPYFTNSDSYTLDVTLPMSVVSNREVFENRNFFIRTKTFSKMKARLVVNNVVLLDGSAKITHVTEDDVKVQLLGGNSELNFLSEDEGYFIDEMELGEIIMEDVEEENEGRDTTGQIHGDDFAGGRNTFTRKRDTGITDTGVRCKDSYVYNETAGTKYICHQYALVDIFMQMFKTLGFDVEECSIDEPFKNIYVASSKATRKVAHVLPHWTIKTFIEEFGKFFNTTVIIDQEYKKVYIKDNQTFFKKEKFTELDIADDYQAEMQESNSRGALASDNLRYDLSNSEHHDYDVIPDNVRDNAPTDTYATRAAVEAAYNAASADDKTKKIYACPDGLYTGWIHDYSDVGGSEEKLLLTQIDVFGPLFRDKEKGKTTDLKICPVAMGEVETATDYKIGSEEWQVIWRGHLPSLENPTGNEYNVNGRFTGGGRQDEEYIPTIQEYVAGESEINKEEKEDRLQVMFIDDIEQPYFTENTRTGEKNEGKMIAGFTDWQYKKNHKGALHNAWSLAMKQTNAAHIGSLHDNGFKFDVGARVCVKFVSNLIPNVTGVFFIKGKLFGCEKIEATIEAKGMQRVMTGYFYEMLP